MALIPLDFFAEIIYVYLYLLYCGLQSEIPQQNNTNDCGVFACTYAKHLARQAPFDFSSNNMAFFRVKIKYEILTKKLLL